MRIPPPEVVASWPAPDYVHPASGSPGSVVACVIFVALMLVAVGLRLYCRAKVSQWFGWDDAMIALALVFAIGLAIIIIISEEVYHWNRHIWDIPKIEITAANIFCLTAKLIFVLAVTFTRLSLCFFYYRLVKDSGLMWFSRLVHLAVGCSLAFCVGCAFTFFFFCTPLKYYWEYPPTTTGRCLNESTTTLVLETVNLAIDVMTWLLPLPLVLRLRMPLRQRIGCCVIFGMGFVVIVTASVRIYYIWKTLFDSWDTTWWSSRLWTASSVEIDIGVICACAPALKTLVLSTRASSRLEGSIQTAMKAQNPNKQPNSSSENTRSATPSSLEYERSSSCPPIKSESRRASAPLHDSPIDIHAWADWKGCARPQTVSTYCGDGDGEGETDMVQIVRRHSTGLDSARPTNTRETLVEKDPIPCPSNTKRWSV